MQVRKLWCTQIVTSYKEVLVRLLQKTKWGPWGETKERYSTEILSAFVARSRIVSFFFGGVREGSYCLAEPVARDFFVVSFLEVNDSCYKRYNKEAFLRDVSNIPWSVIEGARDADDAVYLWEGLFKGGADDHAPMKAKRVNPFTPKSDQCQISSAASPVILHRTVWGIWLFIAYSDERWLYYQFSLPHQYISL